MLLVPGTAQPWMRWVLREAAAQAVTRGAPEAAARYLRRVLEAEPRQRVRALVQLAGSLAETHPAEAIAAAEGGPRPHRRRTGQGDPSPYSWR